MQATHQQKATDLSLNKVEELTSLNEESMQQQMSSFKKSSQNYAQHSGININADQDKINGTAHNFGNMGLHKPKSLQAKLSVNTPGDKYEQEADAIADGVMGMQEVPSMQHIGEEEKKQLQYKPIATNITPVLQTKDGSGVPVSPSLNNKISTLAGSGNDMDKNTQSFMSDRFGTDFSKVNIHANEESEQMNSEINARAFTVGNDIYFNRGEYQPGSSKGKHLLAHELTHVLQQRSTTAMQREPMPADAAVTNLESYDAKTRQDIKYDAGFNLQKGLSNFFQAGIVMAQRKGYNVTFVVRGFAADEAWLEPALKALSLYSFHLDEKNTEDVIKNFTTVQNLDMSSQANPTDAKVKGPNASIRFTSTGFNATGKGAAKVENVQLLIEKMGAATAHTSTETAVDRRARYEKTYKITNAVPVKNDPLGDPPAAMSDTQFDLVLEALDLVPATILSTITDIPIYRGLTAVGPDNEAGEYSQARPKGAATWERRITLYGDFFSATAERRAFLMTHEIGHALDFRPNEGTGKGGASLSADASKTGFMEAVKKDGGNAKGVSTYDETSKSFKEYYGEAFTMYINQPATLKAIRPNVYAYFQTKYP